ncbi:MAG: MFS transporter [Bacteroidota bacterium]
MPSILKKDTLILFSLWLLVFSASCQVMIITPLLPQIQEELNTSLELLGNLVTVYAVMLGISAILMGPYSDKIGRRKILLLGSGSMAIFLVLHQFADSFVSFLSLRALAGASGGILSGAAVAYVGDYFPYEKRGWANGWIMSGIAVGQILGIPLGTFLAEQMGFGFPFIVFGILMAFTFGMVFLHVPQPVVEVDDGKISLASTFHKYIDLLKKPDIRAVTLTYVFMFLGLTVFIVYLPTWLEQTFSISLTMIGYMFAAGGVANAIAGPRAGRLSDQIGRKRMIIVSCIAFSILMISTTYVVVEFWIAYILFPIAMILVAMRMSPLQALSTELVSASKRGSLMSMLVAIGNMGAGLGGAIAGPLYIRFGYLSNTIVAGLMMFAMALVVWKLIPEPELIAHKK